MAALSELSQNHQKLCRTIAGLLMVIKGLTRELAKILDDGDDCNLGFRQLF